MGVVISAYSNVKLLENWEFDEDRDVIDSRTKELINFDSFTHFNSNGAFPGREEGIQVDVPYTHTKRFIMFSNSYGTYGHWRNELAKLAAYPPRQVKGYYRECEQIGACLASEGPFWELLCFSDCEGTLGPVVSAKLAKDFAEWDERASKMEANWYALYQKFRTGFEMAANTGAVRFS